MKVGIIIPAHNEKDFIGLTLESLVTQSHLPSKLIVVDDNSTDETSEIVKDYINNYPWISLITNNSSTDHLPGSKIINAFNKGLKYLDDDYEIICKFDADLIFPKNYLETIVGHFKAKPKLGMAAGFCYVKTQNSWTLENLTRKDHIRGALKAYRKSCFNQIGQLKPAMGWDTIDELLAQYHDWTILTDETLKVKHLKPTGKSYNSKSKYLQGEAMYRMRYGFWITLISALKLALNKGQIKLFIDYMRGYFKAKNKQLEFLVTEKEGQFIRALRWKGIRSKLT